MQQVEGWVAMLPAGYSLDECLGDQHFLVWSAARQVTRSQVS